MKIQAIGQVLELLDPLFDSHHEPVGVTPIVPFLEVVVVHVHTARVFLTLRNI